MVEKTPKQGDIIKINLDPKQGYEQKGFRPYLCLSHELVSIVSNVAVFAPISNTTRDYPFYFSLDELEGIKTVGKVMLDQLVTIDYNARDYSYVESLDKGTIRLLLNLTKLVFDQN